MAVDASNVYTTLMLSAAVGAASMTITKSKFFEGLRAKIGRRNNFLFELVSCPYCMSHWLALVAVLLVPLPVPFIVAWLGVVALAAVWGGMIYRAFA